MKYKIGEIVRITNHSRTFNGHTGKIVGIDGEYHYIDLTLEGDTVSIEAYRTELMRIDAFKEELFEI